jgi:hypothetical protein
MWNGPVSKGILRVNRRRTVQSYVRPTDADCFYLIDIVRKRLVYPDLKAAILDEKRATNPTI